MKDVKIKDLALAPVREAQKLTVKDLRDFCLFFAGWAILARIGTHRWWWEPKQDLIFPVIEGNGTFDASPVLGFYPMPPGNEHPIESFHMNSTHEKESFGLIGIK